MSADETQAERYERLLNEHQDVFHGMWATCSCGAWSMDAEDDVEQVGHGPSHRAHVAQVLAVDQAQTAAPDRDLVARPHVRIGQLDRSICGACDGPFIECARCGVYVCECLDDCRPQSQAVTLTDNEREAACKVMHNAYEAAAPGAGWETQHASRKPWSEVPEANKATMRAAVTALVRHLAARVPDRADSADREPRRAGGAHRRPGRGPGMSAHLLPRSVLDLTCPDEHVITDSQDRRWPWHIERFLFVRATTDEQREMVRTIRRYLNDTCEHHWHDDPSGYGGLVDPYRQCLWCDTVEDLADQDTGSGPTDE